MIRCALRAASSVLPLTLLACAVDPIGPDESTLAETAQAATASVWTETFQNLWLSEVAYWDSSYDAPPEGPTASKRLCLDKLGLRFVHFSEGRRDTEVLVGRRSNTELLVALGGSESGRDWIVDVAAARVSWKGVRVHAGFLAKAQAAYPRIQEHVERYLSSGGARRVVVTGHSLGGAMAQLIAVMLEDDFANLEVRVMTFGAPRVGADDWVEKYNGYPGLRSATIHWVNQQDFVSSFPFDDDRWKVTGRIFRIDAITRDGCDLRGLSSWGEYLDVYGEEPRCFPRTELRATFDARYRDQKLLDGSTDDHALLKGYRKALVEVAPAGTALSGTTCRSTARPPASSPAPSPSPSPPPRRCPPGQRCTLETASQPRCTCIREGGFDP